MLFHHLTSRNILLLLTVEFLFFVVKWCRGLTANDICLTNSLDPAAVMQRSIEPGCYV